jgi:hypothetical protein
LVEKLSNGADLVRSLSGEVVQEAGTVMPSLYTDILEVGEQVDDNYDGKHLPLYLEMEA